MNKRLRTMIVVLTLFALPAMAAAPVPPQPDITITLVQGLPEVMQLGQTYVVEIQVTVSNDVPWLFAIAMPTSFYPGRYVVANGPDRSGSGTEATLYVPFTAKGLTAGLPEMPGVPADHAPVAVVVGARYPGGVVFSERFDFNVEVIP